MNKPMKVKMHSLLLIISIIGVLCACGGQTSATSTPTDKSSGTPSSSKQLGPPDRVDVVYFTQGKPCHCIAAVGDAIQTTMFFNFQDEQSSGKLSFQVVDLDDLKNAVIAKKYNATPFILYILEVRGGYERIIDVPEIWSPRRESIEEIVKRKIEQSLNGEL
ncbi:MAG: hypothetical protein FJ022_05555 [Chloroflexi bacterium]|nr:hypothetical protein [Chloroflexota bacterium]MBM4450254.1 hypothetical protein [Chloroflexota bacterium]